MSSTQNTSSTKLPIPRHLVFCKEMAYHCIQRIVQIQHISKFSLEELNGKANYFFLCIYIILHCSKASISHSSPTNSHKPYTMRDIACSVKISQNVGFIRIFLKCYGMNVAKWLTIHIYIKLEVGDYTLQHIRMPVIPQAEHQCQCQNAKQEEL